MDDVSATDFNCVSPRSNSPPSILSMLTKRQKALLMKFFWPDIAQLTVVCSPYGTKVNSAFAVEANGFTKSSLILIRSLG